VSRLSVLAPLAARLAELPHPARVAIDGVDAAGKTTLAGELAARLPGATRVSADDFLRPREERYRRGRESPLGYYLDSFDHDALRAAVLDAEGLLLVDGIFLLRLELNDLWTFRVFVYVPLEISIERGIARDGPEIAPLYRARYAPGQRRYLDAVRPAERADAVVDNTDVERPLLSWAEAAGRS
jgi:uridine kinase